MVKNSEAPMIEIHEVNVDDLNFAEYNPRRLTKDQFEHLKDSLTRFGFVDPIVLNRHPDRMNVIVGGHQRVKTWKEMGNKTAPAVFVELDLQSERELNIRLNKNTGEFDWDLLANNFDKDELMQWGFSQEELLGGLEIESIAPTTGDNDVPEECKTISVKGDLYELGKHRLLCGDSVKVDDVELLMKEGGPADIIITDPPWNVNYGADDNNGHYKARTIKNDNMKAPDWALFCDELAGSLFLASKPGAMIYLVMSAQEWPAIDLALRENGFHWSSTIIWAKDRLVLSRKDYHTRYEPIWYGWNGEAPRLFPLKDRKQDDVWEIQRPHVSELHPTTKPIELIEKMLMNSSKPESIVLDLFGGSGSTLIAAEKCGRYCRMMELDPKYCDVIVQRYVDFCIKNSREWCVLRNNIDISEQYGASAAKSNDKRKIRK